MKNGLTVLSVSRSLSLSFPSALFSPLFLWCRRPLFFHAAMFFVIIRETNEKQERKKASGLVSSHHHHSLIPPSLPLVLYPPSFCLPEWQLAASRVQWACQPKSRYLPTDLRKYTFERDWLMRAVALYLWLLLFFGWLRHMQHTLHSLLPAELCGH